jgi:hypothetical protein
MGIELWNMQFFLMLNKGFLLLLASSHVQAQYFMQRAWDDISSGPNDVYTSKYFFGNEPTPADPNPINYYTKGSNLVMKGDIDVYIMYYTTYTPASNGGDGKGGIFPSIAQRTIIESFINNIDKTGWWRVGK